MFNETWVHDINL